MTSNWRSVDHAEIIGFSSQTPRQLLEQVQAGKPMKDLPGDFVLIARGVTATGCREDLVATSVMGTRPYFIVDNSGPPSHGPNVFDLAQSSGGGWAWDLDALRSVAWLGHTVDGQSLHPKVRRVPADSVLRHRGMGRWSISTGDFWSTAFNQRPVPLDSAVDTFSEVSDEVVSEEPVVSLSAGFDSRALLAWALSKGLHPTIITMGSHEATDVVVAREIAAGEGLEHRVIGLDPRDYFVLASKITRLTGGSKTLGNWHTYLYPREQMRARQLHLVGANGEFARSYYLDRGIVSRAFQSSGAAGVAAYWLARLTRRSKRLQPWLPFLGGPTEARALAGRLTSLAGVGGGDGMQRLDRLYAKHRVRHFIGNGLALYAAHGHPVSPFLDARTIAAMAGLDRRFKLGSRFHRRVIERHAPRLLGYPAGSEASMGAVPPRLYWRHSFNGVSYSPAPSLIAGAQATETLRESPYLNDLMTKNEIGHAAATGTIEVKEYLLTLHFAGQTAAEVGAGA